MAIQVFNSSEKEFTRWKYYYNRLMTHGVYHSPDYVRLMQSPLRGEAELAVYGDDDHFVYYPYFKRRLSALAHLDKSPVPINELFDISSSWYYGGPLSSNHSDKELLTGFRVAFSDYCRKAGIVSEFIRFDPYLANHQYHLVDINVRKERDVIYIDLTRDEETIFEKFDKKCRKNYKKAIKSDVQLKYGDNLNWLSDFIDLYNAEMERKNAPRAYRFSRRFFEQLIQNNREQSFFITIHVGNAFAGGSIALRSGERVHDYLRATNPEFWPMRINDFLLIENILYFKDLGFKEYDLQGGRRGVYEFKRSFSDLTRPFLIGNCIHLHDIYNTLASAVAQIDNNFFPAYRLKERN